ncbi:SIMPL domain-containing protein [Sphingomonas crocodyli]|uniref:SIMPL domain-containing protein n=1 Tax=Sphingomonas crocodyli TaxID=1979270 RepID=UPI0013E335FF|nr:SIMPL domain-containing protein [Sphingomonas crocodyli]
MLSSSPAPAQYAVPVAAGEVPLEIVTYGSSENTAQEATMSVCVTSRSKTASEADSAARSLAEKVRAALVAQGIPSSDLVLRQPGNVGRMGFVGNEAFDPEDMPAALAQMQQGNATKSATAYIDVTVRDLTKLDQIRRSLLDLNASFAAGPILKLRDEDAARRAAIADAVAKAQREADDYAAALHMRVSRIVRIKNSAPVDAAFNMNMLQRLTSSNLSASVEDKVTTDVRVTVEFVLSK